MSDLAVVSQFDFLTTFGEKSSTVLIAGSVPAAWTVSGA
jgi:hypothetical protein